MLKSIGELITSRVNAIVRRFEKKFLNTLEPKHIQTKTAVVLVSSMILLMTAYGSLVPYLLGWTFDEGVYYSFITFLQSVLETMFCILNPKSKVSRDYFQKTSQGRKEANLE